MEPGTSDAAHQYLKGELEVLLKWFDEHSTSHKKLFRKVRYIIFGLTAVSSVLAGLALAIPEIQTGTTVAIVLTSAAIGIATSFEGLRKPNELWIHERTVYYSLKDLQRELEYHKAELTDSKKSDAYFDRLQSILGSSREKWSGEILAGRTNTDSPEGPSVASMEK